LSLFLSMKNACIYVKRYIWLKLYIQILQQKNKDELN